MCWARRGPEGTRGGEQVVGEGAGGAGWRRDRRGGGRGRSEHTQVPSDPLRWGVPGRLGLGGGLV